MSSHSTTSDFTISSNSIMSVDSIRPVYNLVELDLEEYEENELVLNTIHELKPFFDQSDNCTCRYISKQKDIRTCC